MKRSLEARGVTIVPNSRVQPPWAAQRYEVGESCQALALAYGEVTVTAPGARSPQLNFRQWKGAS